MKMHNLKSSKEIRRQLRRSPTAAEATLWKALRGSKVAGKKFRRQHGIGNYVVDFYWPECRLAIELDGEGHFSSMGSERDLRRSEFFRKHNIRVVRFENRALNEHPDGVLRAIEDYLKKFPTTP